jgi:hypothetical protein
VLFWCHRTGTFAGVCLLLLFADGYNSGERRSHRIAARPTREGSHAPAVNSTYPSHMNRFFECVHGDSPRAVPLADVLVRSRRLNAGAGLLATAIQYTLLTAEVSVSAVRLRPKTERSPALRRFLVFSGCGLLAIANAQSIAIYFTKEQVRPSRPLRH